jgi:hypothetical protein
VIVRVPSRLAGSSPPTAAEPEKVTLAPFEKPCFGWLTRTVALPFWVRYGLLTSLPRKLPITVTLTWVGLV